MTNLSFINEFFVYSGFLFLKKIFSFICMHKLSVFLFLVYILYII